MRGGVIPDSDPPTGSIVINNNDAYTNSVNVTLTLSADDPSGVSQMCISNTGSCSSWEAYAASKPWALSGGDGNKTVYVWFKDNPGNIDGTPYSDAILLDTTAPSNGSLTATPGHEKVNLNWSGFSDATSGLKDYKLVFSTAGTPSSCSDGTEIYSGTNTSYLHTPLDQWDTLLLSGLCHG